MVGVRTVKSGQSRWFVGYKKHSLRLWLSRCSEQVLLVPLLSWAAPANQNDVLFLDPSLCYCRDKLNFLPDLVIGDQAYLNFSVQQRWREQWQVGVLTALKPDLEIPKAVEPALRLCCAQGQRLQWWGLCRPEQLHWFVVRDPDPLCVWCPEQSRCPREFAFAAGAHETVLGTIPVNTPLARTLRRRVRPWIEAAQSYEKNQLGLADVFLNSLRLCWILCLLADTVCLLRAHALVRRPPTQSLLKLLLPSQLELELEEN